MGYLFTTFLLLLTLTTDCLSQSRKRQRIEEIKTDTVNIFHRLDNEFFKEKNIFWMDKGELGIIQSQRFNDPCCIDDEYELNLTVVFDNWDSIELNRDYDLANLRTDCEQKGVFWRNRFNTPIGQIRLTNNTNGRLTFHFDIKVMSDSKDEFLIYAGNREFRPDY